MEYRQFGPTGIKVSVLGYGCYMFKEQWKNPEEETYLAVKKCLELGINFFDTSEAYAAGESEINLGKALKKLNVKREEVVISTKLFSGAFDWGAKIPTNGNGLSRKRVVEGLNASLKRLQLDYVDVVFCHRFDPETPLEEVCRAFSHVIDQGKAFYWGTSEWSAYNIARAIDICKDLNLHRPVVEQPQYNLLNREKVEAEFGDLFDKYGLAITSWSPLAQGLLTGKYLENEKTDGRFNQINPFMSGLVKQLVGADKYFGPDKIEDTKKKFKVIEEIGKQLGGSVALVALAWTIKNKDISTVLFGASKVSQIEDNFKAIEIAKKFTPEIEQKLSTLFGNTPDTGFNLKTFQKFPSRR